jgi:hypothetical protein
VRQIEVRVFEKVQKAIEKPLCRLQVRQVRGTTEQVASAHIAPAWSGPVLLWKR